MWRRTLDLKGIYGSRWKYLLNLFAFLILGMIIIRYSSRSLIVIAGLVFCLILMRYNIYPFYLFLLLTPILNPGLNFGFYTIYLGSVLILISFIALEFKGLLLRSSDDPLSSPITPLYLILLLIALFSMFRNFDPGVTMRGLLLLAQPFVIFLLIFKNFKDKTGVIKILYLFVIGGILGAFLGILQYLLPHIFVRYTSILEQYSVPLYHGFIARGVARINGMFGDANTYGQFLVQVTVCAFGLFLIEKSRKRKFFLIGGLLVSLIALGFSYSRGAWFSLLAASAILSLVLLPGRASKIKAVSVVVLMVIILVFAVPEFTPRFISFFNPYTASRVTRLQQYKDTVSDVLQHPLLGRGVGFYQYRGELQAAAHSIYLNMADEIGIPGLMVFLWILFMVGRDSIRFLRQTEDHSAKILVATLLSGIVAFFGHGITENALYSVKIGWIPGLAMGLIYSLRRMSLDKERGRRQSDEVLFV